MVSTRVIFACISCIFYLSINQAKGQCPYTSTTQSPTTSSPDGSCAEFPDSCSNNYTVNNDGFTCENSPFWDVLTSVGGDHEDIDNVCNTFLPVGDNCYLYFRCVTYKNNTVLVKRELYVPLPYEGAWTGYGVQKPTGCDSCVYNDYILGQPSKDAYVLYRCYLFGPCVPQFGEQDQLFGFSSNPNVTEEARQALRDFFGDNKYIEMPNKLPSSCVVKVGDTPVYGAERVPCANRISVP